METIKFKITDPNSGQTRIFERPANQLEEKIKLADERGLIFELLTEEDTTEPESFLEDLGPYAQGASLEWLDEIKEKLLTPGQLERAKQKQKIEEQKSPASYNIKKLIGSMLPNIAASGLGALGGAKLGGAIGATGGPIGAAGGALLGGALGAGAAGFAQSLGESEEINMGELEKAFGSGVISAVLESGGRFLTTKPFLKLIKEQSPANIMFEIKILQKKIKNYADNIADVEKAWVQELFTDPEDIKWANSYLKETKKRKKTAEQALFPLAVELEARQAVQQSIYPVTLEGAIVGGSAAAIGQKAEEM